MSGPMAVVTDGLTRDFGPVRALDGLNLEVPTGIVFGFLGPNGSGKTTTIRLLLGLLEPTRGQARVLGLDARSQAHQIRDRTGTLLEHTGLYERLSAEDNLEFFGRVYGLDRIERRCRTKELLSGMGLWDRRRENVRNWSRGMKQKLVVARALLHRPQLVFLDEPSAGLDPVAAASLRDDIASVAASEGVTVFLTTHNLVEAEKICSLVGVLRQGRLLTVGHPNKLKAAARGHLIQVRGSGLDAAMEEIRSRPEVEGVSFAGDVLEIRLRGDAPASPLVSLLVQSGAGVEEVHRSAASLEEAFMSLMEEKSD